MDKDRFLRQEHARITASGEFVASEWRDSVDRFIADLWDMTPLNRCGRYLAPKDKKLGFARENVEYAFERSARRVSAMTLKKKLSAKKPQAKSKPKRLTKEERRAAQNTARLERRRKLAEEILRWEKHRRAGA